MTLRAYVNLLRLEDTLKSHKFYFHAAKIAIEVRRVMENLESHGIFVLHFPGLEKGQLALLVMDSHGISKCMKKKRGCMKCIF